MTLILRLVSIPFSVFYGMLLWLLYHLDESHAYAVSNRVVPMIMFPFRQRRRLNIQRFSSEQDASSATFSSSLERAHLDYLTTLTVEFARLPYITPEELEQKTILVGEEHLQAALKQGRGALLFLPHFGNAWHSIAQLAARGYPTNLLSYRTPLHSINLHIRKLCAHFKICIIRPRTDTSKIAKSIMKKNELFILLYDIPIPSKNRIHVPFGKTSICVHLGTGLLALRSGAPVLRMVSRILPSGQSQTIIEPPMNLPVASYPRNDSELVLRSLIHHLENEIFLCPEQWWSWSYVVLGKDNVACTHIKQPKITSDLQQPVA